jgi:hypothetical protein
MTCAVASSAVSRLRSGTPDTSALKTKVLTGKDERVPMKGVHPT